jgi:hypothetical protein
VIDALGQAVGRSPQPRIENRYPMRAKAIVLRPSARPHGGNDQESVRITFSCHISVEKLRIALIGLRVCWFEDGDVQTAASALQQIGQLITHLQLSRPNDYCDGFWSKAETP